MTEKIELKTVLAGPKGVLMPGVYTVERLREVGYEEPPASSPDAAGTADNAGDGGGDPGGLDGSNGVSHPVTMVGGIGPKTAAVLDELGIDTVAALGLADPAELAEKLDGVSAEKAAGWVDEAYHLVLTNYGAHDEEE